MKFFLKIIVVLGLFLFSTCNQDPIFSLIAIEEPPRDPKINGSPSKIVGTAAGDKLYVANGSLWEFSGNSWNSIGSTGKVRDVALVNNVLYFMTIDGTDTHVYRQHNLKEVTNGTGWTFIQRIIGVNNLLFAAVRQNISNDRYRILKLKDESGGLSWEPYADNILGDHSYELRGVEWDGANYFFATAGAGVFKGTDSGTKILIDATRGASITGTFTVDQGTNPKKIIAVTTDNKIYDLSNGGVYSKSLPFTGTIAMWNWPASKGGADNYKLLLLGVAGGIGNYGYAELSFKSDGTLYLEESLRIPGASPPMTSAADKDKYRSQLQDQAVNGLIQAPSAASGEDGRPVLFASTQKNGVWSYRGVWNAEE